MFPSPRSHVERAAEELLKGPCAISRTSPTTRIRDGVGDPVDQLEHDGRNFNSLVSVEGWSPLIYLDGFF